MAPKSSIFLAVSLASSLVLSAICPSVAKESRTARSLPTCHIVYANDRTSSTAIYWHEMAHCLGWDHPIQSSPKVGQKYQAYPVPQEYVGKKYQGPTVIWAMSSEKAAAECDGHWGCSWFE